MSTWYDAQAGIIATANSAMAEIASHAVADDCDIAERIAEIWEPIANALRDSEPDFDEWPELKAQADECDTDYVGVTSDSRQVVRWGPEHWYGGGRGDSWREFVILERAAS